MDTAVDSEESMSTIRKFNGFEIVQRDWSFTTLKKDNKHD